jgi:hypothetical protein
MPSIGVLGCCKSQVEKNSKPGPSQQRHKNAMLCRGGAAAASLRAQNGRAGARSHDEQRGQRPVLGQRSCEAVAGQTQQRHSWKRRGV